MQRLSSPPAKPGSGGSCLRSEGLGVTNAACAGWAGNELLLGAELRRSAGGAGVPAAFPAAGAGVASGRPTGVFIPKISFHFLKDTPPPPPPLFFFFFPCRMRTRLTSWGCQLSPGVGGSHSLGEKLPRGEVDPEQEKTRIFPAE